MTDQYLDAFVRESEEEITKLNNSLLDLEAEPDDRAAMDQIFRTAHTLKGNFGAMGFEGAAELAHAIEDLLDAVRRGEMAVTPAVMDPVFAGVDQIESIVGEIEERGESTVETDETVDQLRAILAAGTAADSTEEAGRDASGAETGAASDETGDRREVATDGSLSVDLGGLDVTPGDLSAKLVRAEVDVGEAEMPGVDAMLALEGVEEVFEVVGTSPDRASVEDGEYDGTFAVFVDAADLGRVDAELDALGAIDDATVTDVSDVLAGAGPGGSGGEAGAGGAAGQADNAADHAVDEIRSVRVDVGRLDDLHGQVEQLVTSRIKLRRSVESGDLDGAAETLTELDKVTANLQNTVMDMRLIPLKKVVGKFPRMVRDLARELDKEVNFEIEGEDIELDRTILTEVSDPLMHVIRNSLDHGIESPDEREAAGKPREGTVTLRASRERDHVVVEVQDDGAGLDPESIAETAVAEGVRSAEEVETMADSAIFDLVFHPGFSTTEEVTDVSGRGVGMDVVHDTVTRLDGSVSVDSTPGEGTTVRLRLPVTMAIVTILFVQVGDEEYGVPIKNVDEITRTGSIRTVNGREVVKHDGELYPVVELAETFEVPGDTATNGDGVLVRVRESERRVALRCDAVNAQEEVVVKPLEGILSGTPGLSGTAVLGDGKIVHILDVVTL